MDTKSPGPPPGAPLTFRPGGMAARLRARAASGFTLVEVMVATFVMLFSISSAILVMQSGFRTLDTARKTTLASQIMQSEMERMRMLSWSRVQALIPTSPATIDIATIFPQNTAAERKILDQMKLAFTATRTAGYLAGSSDEIIEIGITITWKGIDGTRHERTSSTRYCKNGLYNYYYTLNKTAS